MLSLRWWVPKLLAEDLANPSLEFGLSCEYFRERKKRGKASRRDLAEQQSALSLASANPPSPTKYSSEDPAPTGHNLAGQKPLKSDNSCLIDLLPSPVPATSIGWSENGAGQTVTVDGLNDYSRSDTLSIDQVVLSYGTSHQQHQQMSEIRQGVHPHHQLPQAAQMQAREISAPGPWSSFDCVQSYGPSMIHGMSAAERDSNENMMHQPLAIDSANTDPIYNEGGYPCMSLANP